jgi:hypothetical protein
MLPLGSLLEQEQLPTWQDLSVRSTLLPHHTHTQPTYLTEISLLVANPVGVALADLIIPALITDEGQLPFGVCIIWLGNTITYKPT